VLPVLNQHNPLELAAIANRQLWKEPGQELFAQLLLKAPSKVTVIATGRDVERSHHMHASDLSVMYLGQAHNLQHSLF
jgi:hypothetical protein